MVQRNLLISCPIDRNVRKRTEKHILFSRDGRNSNLVTNKISPTRLYAVEEYKKIIHDQFMLTSIRSSIADLGTAYTAVSLVR